MLTDERLQEIKAEIERLRGVTDLLAEVGRLRAVNAALHRELVGQLEDEHSAEPWQAESYVVAIERKAQADEDEEPGLMPLDMVLANIVPSPLPDEVITRWCDAWRDSVDKMFRDFDDAISKEDHD